MALLSRKLTLFALVTATVPSCWRVGERGAPADVQGERARRH